MLKKTFISSIIFLSISSAAFAKATTYVGGGLGVGGYSQVNGLNGASANVFAGKGKLLDKEENFYLGGEVGASVNHNSIHRARTSYGLNASIIPGVMLTKSTMLYGRVGLASNYHPKNSLQFATQVGVGVQTKVAKQWDVRTEYTSFGSNHSSQAGVGLVYKFD